MGVGKVPSDDVQLNDFTEVEGKDAEAGVSMDDELADSEGEMDTNVYRASATTGRKFRIVDLEDEDWDGNGQVSV